MNTLMKEDEIDLQSDSRKDALIMEPEICIGVDPSGGGGIAYAESVPVAQAVQPPTTNALSSDAMARLKAQGYPKGLAVEMGNSRTRYPLRFWIVDNSGSMRSTDGSRLIADKNQVHVVPCSRWLELQGAVDYHIELAGLLEYPTVFRMLNDPGSTVGPQEFCVGQQSMSREADVEKARSIIRNDEPHGVTPLSQHVRDIYQRVKSMEGILKSQGQKAVVVIATDGLPSDEMGYSSEQISMQFADDLRMLQTLPVWIVVRLCTDEDSVVEYYNNLDKKLELPLEVLDDFFSEGQEIHDANPWLNYGLPLHRCREMGYHHRIFDLLDEKLLSKDEILELVELLFGKEQLQNAPNIHTKWNDFLGYLSRLVAREGKIWNPATKKVDYWIDTKKMKRIYGNHHFWGLCQS